MDAVAVVCVDARWRVAVVAVDGGLALPTAPRGPDPAASAAARLAELGLAVPVLLPRARLDGPEGPVDVYVGHAVCAPAGVLWLRPSEARARLDPVGARAVEKALSAC